MEAIAALIVAAGLIYGLVIAGRSIGRLGAAPAPPPRRVVRPSPTSNRRRVQANAQARVFQTALLRLREAQDFRRAAVLAAIAKLVPAAFRRRQFARFRPELIRHYGRCLSAGTDPEVLLQSLRDLVTALGIAPFEAEYIRTEAAARSARLQSFPSPGDRVAALRREHETRAAAIRQGVGQTPELQEQLLETEESRYRQALLALFDEPSPTAATHPML